MVYPLKLYWSTPKGAWQHTEKDDNSIDEDDIGIDDDDAKVTISGVSRGVLAAAFISISVAPLMQY